MMKIIYAIDHKVGYTSASAIFQYLEPSLALNLHRKRIILARLWGHVVVIMKSIVSWNVTPCYLVSSQTRETHIHRPAS